MVLNAKMRCFLLNQSLKQNYAGEISPTEQIARSIIGCVDGFALETFIKSQNDGNDWVTNKVENAMTKRKDLFHKWVSDPSDFNMETYGKQRNLVTSVIRNAKREAIFNKLGKTPSTTTMYRTLKCHH